MAKVGIVEVPTYTLEISKDEAELLASLLGCCVYAGPGQELYDALINAGVSELNWSVNDSLDGRMSTIFPKRVEDDE